MSIPLVVNGTTYNYPTVHDVGWGPVATAWASAVTLALQPLTGGFLTLPYPTSGIVFRNATNTGNLPLTVNSSNQLTFNGTPIGATTSLTDAHIFVGSALNFPADVALSGDATITDTGVLTIGAGVITLAKMGHGTANQLTGTNAAGTAGEYKTLQGTTNQVIVTNGANLITLSAPQDLNVLATPTFQTLTLNGSATPASLTFSSLGVPLAQLLMNGNDTFLDYGGAIGRLVFRSGYNGATRFTMYPDGSMSATNNLDMGSNHITGLAQATIAGEAVAFPITGAQMTNGTITGTQIASSVALAGSPTTSTAAVNTRSTVIATTAFVNPANSLGTPGYQTLSSGVKLQWGLTGILPHFPGAGQTITFPVAFTSFVGSVQVTIRYTNASPNDGTFAAVVGGVSLTQFTVVDQDSNTDWDAYWFAIGV